MKKLEKGYVIISIMNVNYNQCGISSASISEVNEMKKIFQEELKEYTITDSVNSDIFEINNDKYVLKERYDLSDVDSYYKYIFLQGNEQLKLLWDEEFVYNKLLDIRQKNINYFKPASLEDIIGKIVKKPERFYRDIAASLSTEEYNFIQGMLDNKECGTCFNKYCEKSGIKNCSEYVNPERVGRAKILLKG